MKRSPLLIIFFAAVCLLSAAQQSQAQTAYSYCEVGYDSDARYVYGYAATYLDYYAAYYYDPEVHAFLTYENTEIGLDEGYGYGYGIYPAEVSLFSWFYRPSTTYYTFSTHFVRSYYSYSYCYDCWYDPYGFSFFSNGSIYGGYYPFYSGFYNPNYYYYGRRYVVGRLYVGITTPQDNQCGSGYSFDAGGNPCPTPTPAPVITPTPTPTPSPTVSIQSFAVVAKNGTETVSVTVSPQNNQVPITLSLRATQGTGEA